MYQIIKYNFTTQNTLYKILYKIDCSHIFKIYNLYKTFYQTMFGQTLNLVFS